MCCHLHNMTWQLLTSHENVVALYTFVRVVGYWYDKERKHNGELWTESVAVLKDYGTRWLNIFDGKFYAFSEDVFCRHLLEIVARWIYKVTCTECFLLTIENIISIWFTQNMHQSRDPHVKSFVTHDSWNIPFALTDSEELNKGFWSFK